MYRRTRFLPLLSSICLREFSISSNIAEGSSRKTEKERLRFYQISRSSLVEIDTQIEISVKLNYLNTADIRLLSDLSTQIFAMLSKMLKS